VDYVKIKYINVTISLIDIIVVVVVICIASSLIVRQCSDSTALLQAYAEAILHSEEGTFQTQPYC